jgi:tartrate-resistant acid phosphatase type 5
MLFRLMRALLLLVLCSSLRAETVLDLVLFGDWGAKPEKAHRVDRQVAVAKALAGWMRDGGVKPHAIVLLGDNFYGGLTGVDDPRWKTQFTDMYPRADFPMPFYFTLGNNDYEDGDRKSFLYQLRFRGNDRWQLPVPAKGASWGRVDLPPADPLLTLFLFANSTDNVRQNAEKHDPPQLGWKDQVKWLHAELAKKRSTPWLAAAGHYPIYSHGAHHTDDGPKREGGMWFNDREPWIATRRDLLPPLRKAGLQFWFGGHDHNLQHLKWSEAPEVDVLVSGAGGGTGPYGRHPLAPKDSFVRAFPGWLHMRFTRTKATAAFWFLDAYKDKTRPGKLVKGGEFSRSADR